ncbi:hypothetical protein HY570_02430, partial [Candidatus Micrarchaeota archaeon]|nr:hypothetical protein [Candidatus Micrarchaeota archaeon]
MPQKQMDSQNKQSTNLDKWAIIIFSNLEDHVRSYYKGVDSLSRLEEFLKWFYPQKAKLLEQFKQDLHDGKINVPIGDFLNMQFAAGFWLGTRYAAHVGSKFTSEKAGEFPRIIPPEKKDYDMYGRRIIREKTASAEFDARSGVFRMQLFDLSDANFTAQLRKLEYPAIVLMGFNLGLHEGTHALPYVFYQNISLRKPSTLQNILLRTQSLSELATSYSQSNYGLPIKSVDLNRIPAGFSFGARYAPHSLGPSSGLSNRIDYNREYFEHFLAPYLLPRLGGKFNLFNL